MEAAMRSEEEMMNLILQVAKDDERVRAVYLNGSRLILMHRRIVFRIMMWYML